VTNSRLTVLFFFTKKKNKLASLRLDRLSNGGRYHAKPDAAPYTAFIGCADKFMFCGVLFLYQKEKERKRSWQP